MESIEYDDGLVAARGLVRSADRSLLGLAGAPGAGKSTLAARLATALGPTTVVVPLDGFHHSDTNLRRRSLNHVKGAPDTFDRTAFVALLRRLRSSASPLWVPLFDRAAETTLPNALRVPAAVRLAIVEGNYLLHWPEVRSLLDEVWYVEASSRQRRIDALVARHEHFGRTSMQAQEWVSRSDEANARLVEETRSLADRVVTVW